MTLEKSAIVIENQKLRNDNKQQSYDILELKFKNKKLRNEILRLNSGNRELERNLRDEIKQLKDENQQLRGGEKTVIYKLDFLKLYIRVSVSLHVQGWK